METMFVLLFCQKMLKFPHLTHLTHAHWLDQVLIELARYGEKPVGELEAIRLADRLGARTYVESSALTQRNLKEVFDEAIVAALSSNEDLRRLTAASSSGRSRTGNRLLNSIRENWRLSQASGSTERGGLLLRCSMRRSKMADNSTAGALRKQGASKNKKKPSVWKRLFCCHCCCSAWAIYSLLIGILSFFSFFSSSGRKKKKKPTTVISFPTMAVAALDEQLVNTQSDIPSIEKMTLIDWPRLRRVYFGWLWIVVVEGKGVYIFVVGCPYCCRPDPWESLLEK